MRFCAVDHEHTFSLFPIAAALYCYGARRLPVKGVALHKGRCNIRIGYAWYFYTLCAAEDCRQYRLCVFRDKQEECLCGRFLDYFQQFVGTSLVHLFGQPYYHYLPSALTGLHCQLVQYFGAFALIYYRLLIFDFELCEPIGITEVGRFLKNLAPLGYVIIADGVPVARSVLLFLYRKDKMKVGMHQFVHLHTRWATAASISVRTVAAKDITG